MQILHYDIAAYGAAERDLCKLHRVSEEETLIDMEIEEIQQAFSKLYEELTRDDDYEFPSWHHNLRLFWVYLHSDAFYDERFIPHVQALLAARQRSWFAQFECYSPSLKSPQLPSGFVGDFIVYKDTVIFSNSDKWALFEPKLLPGQCSPHAPS
jgi:hypothetical protein